MSSFCLSSAPILRCVPLSRYQSIVILIPTAIEVVFTSSLVISQRNSGHKRHLLLTAEGWVYLTLSIFELLTHVLESAQGNVDIFAGLDVTTGVASFLPLFFYCFFLYIYSDTELLPNAVSLPKKLGKVASLLLLILIPAIIGLNEVASFVGIERRLDGRTPPQVVIGFSSQRNWTLNLFFSSLSLVLMTLFQAIVFMIAAFRLFVAVINQRRFDNLGQDAVHLINGVGWLSAGMKLGAIESTIGFGGGSFGIVLARRILRLLARACLCIGVVKGVDEVEDFRAIRQEMADSKAGYIKTSSSRNIKALISNPRLSTFQHVANSNKEGHLLSNPTFDYNRAPQSQFANQDRGSFATPPAHLRSLQEVAGMATFETLNRGPTFGSIAPNVAKAKQRERVTIYRQSNGAPTLLLRLSDTDFPSPRQIGVDSASSKTRSWISFATNHPNRMIWDFGNNPPPPKESPFASELDPAESSRDTQAFAPPRQPFAEPDNGFRNSTGTQSVSDSVAEIVIAPQHTLSQSSARARLYRTSSSKGKARPDLTIEPLPTLVAPLSMSPTEYEVPQETEKDKSSSAAVSKERMDSGFSLQSLPDTLQAVRELAREFPGPPLTFNGRPVMGGLPVTPAWNGHGTATPSISSAQSPSSIATIKAYGSPSDFSDTHGANVVGGLISLPANPKPAKLRKKVDDEETRIEKTQRAGRYEPRPVIMPASFNQTPSPASISTVKLNRPEIYISDELPPGATEDPLPHPSLFLRGKSARDSVQTNRSLDPFDDSYSSPETERSVTPIHEVLNRPTLLRPHPSRLDMSAIRPRQPKSVPSTPENITPLTSYTVTIPSRVPNGGGSNPFSELALGTGTSSDLRKWRHDSTAVPGQSSLYLPTPPAEDPRSFGKPSSLRWKYNSGTSSIASTALSMRPPEKAFAPGDGIPTTPIRFSSIGLPMPLQPRLQQRLGSGKASDGFAANSTSPKRRPPSKIIWLPQSGGGKSPSLRESTDFEDDEEGERRLREAISMTSSLGEAGSMVSRVKTVGSVSSMRATPEPTTPQSSRRSLYAEPIIYTPPPMSHGRVVEVV